MKIKLLKLILVFIIFISLEAKAQWIPSGGPLGCSANQFAKSSGGKLWVCADNGLYYSTNDGITWEPINRKVEYCSQIIAFGDTLMLVYHKFVKTTNFFSNDYFETNCLTSIDNGISWSQPHLIFNNSITNYYYYIKQMGTSFLYTTESSGSMNFESNDFGQTWVTATPAVNSAEITKTMYSNQTAYHNEFKMNFPSPTVIYNCVSFDSKNTWAYIDSSGNNNLKAIGAVDNAVLFLADTLNPKILRSTNLGNSFDTVLTSSVSYPIFSHIFNDKDTLYVYFYNNTNQFRAFKSIDKGITWNQLAAQFPMLMNNSFVRTNNGDYLYRGGNGIAKYSPILDSSVNFNNSIKSQWIFKLTSSGNNLYGHNNKDVYKSIDNGDTWINTTNNYYINNIYDIKAKGDTVVYITNDSIHLSINSGISWNVHSKPYSLTDLFIVNSLLVLRNDTANYMPYQSADWGGTWNVSLFPMGVPTGQHFLFQDENDTLFNMVVDINTNAALLYEFKPLLNQFDLLGTCNISNFNFTKQFEKSGNKWFTYGPAGGSVTPFLHSNDGLNWNLPNIASLPPNPLIEPYFGKPVYANGIYYSYCNDTIMLSSFDGSNWNPMPANNSLRFQNFWSSFRHQDMLNHKGILYMPTFGSSIWRRNDTIRTFTGNVYFDANNNSIKDVGETNLQNIVVATPNAFSNTNSLGIFNLLTDQQGDSLKITLLSNAFTSNPSYILTNNNQLTNNNFGIYGPPNISDFKTDVTNTVVFRPGFQTNVVVNVTNNGTLNQTSNLSLSIDTNVTVLSTNPTPTSIVGNLYTWNLSAIPFTQQQTIQLNVQTKITATLGDTVHFVANCTPANTDIYLANNVDTLREIIVGSYDPNDKTCKQGSNYTVQQLNNNEELEYVIRFQNTGTFPASYVRIEDTLSTLLDWSSIKIVNSSHVMNYTLKGNGAIHFVFDPINLPGMIQNEPESHGFVKYTILPKKSVAVGNVIQNTAYIYFDFNSPIVTNTTSTEIVYQSIVLSTEQIPLADQYKNSILIYPNPARSSFSINYNDLLNNHTSTLFLYDINGRKSIQKNMKDKINLIECDGLKDGLYFGVILDDKGKKISNFKIEIKK